MMLCKVEMLMSFFSDFVVDLSLPEFFSQFLDAFLLRTPIQR